MNFTIKIRVLTLKICPFHANIIFVNVAGTGKLIKERETKFIAHFKKLKFGESLDWKYFKMKIVFLLVAVAFGHVYSQGKTEV